MRMMRFLWLLAAISAATTLHALEFNPLNIREIRDVGIPPSVVTGIVESAAVTNGGAKAYADATFLHISGGTMDGSILFKEGGYADFSTEDKGFHIGNRHITVNGKDPDTDYYFDDGSQSLGQIQIVASREWTTQVLVRAENPIFSNAVLEVATNISTNDFAAIRAIADLPATEGAVTIGAILAALAAAVLALKRKKVDATSVCAEWSSSTTYGAGENVMYEGKFYASKLASNLNHKPTDTTWWDVCSLFTSANTSNNAENVRVSAADATPMKTYTDGMAKYPIVDYTAATGILDRTINVVGSAVASVEVPENFTDLIIRADVASSLAVTVPAEITQKYGDAFPSAAGNYVVTITKLSATEALVKTIKLEAQS